MLPYWMGKVSQQHDSDDETKFYAALFTDLPNLARDGCYSCCFPPKK